MSRTDVHAPSWVKQRDPAWWRTHYTEDHEHVVQEHWDPEQRQYLVRRTVACDLDKFLSGEDGTHCRMRYTGPNNILCGCPSCTGRDGRKLGRRRERATWRAAARAILKTGPDDMDTVDVPAPRNLCPW